MRSIVTLLSRVRPSFRGSFVWSLATVIGLAALSGAASGALPALVGAALSALVPAGAAPAAPGTLSSGLSGLAELPAWAVVAIAFAGTFGTVALAVLSSRLGSQLSGELTAALRIEMLRRVLGASPREVERAGREMVEQRGGPAPPPGVKLPEARGGEAVKLAIARESGLVADFVIAALTGLPQALVTLLVLTAELALGGRWLVLVGGAGLFLLSRLVAARASRRVAEATQGMQREDVRVFADLGEKLTLTEDLRLAGAREQAAREFAEAAHRAADARSHFARALAVSGQIKSVFSAMSPLVILLALRLGDATPDAGQVAKLLLYVPLLIARFEGLDGIRMGLEERRRVIQATLALLSLPASPAPSAHPVPLSQLRDTTLVLEGVRFTPKGSTKPILDGLSLTVPDGAIVGIAGPSGCGKSTLLRLLLRLDEPDEGTITVGGVPLADLAPEALPKLFGVLSQTTRLFERSLAQNLTLGLDPAPTNDVLAAAMRTVALGELVDGQGGRSLATEFRAVPPSLSGGEQRRVMLARLLVREARIFVLDEPEAGLPSATAEALLASVSDIAAGRTCLVVTHAPHLLRSTFNVVMDGGKVAAKGSHAELAASNATYRALLAEGLREPGGAVPRRPAT